MPRPHFAVKNLFCNIHTIICTINGKIKVTYPKYPINTGMELLSTAIWVAKKGLVSGRLGRTSSTYFSNIYIGVLNPSRCPCPKYLDFKKSKYSHILVDIENILNYPSKSWFFSLNLTPFNQLLNFVVFDFRYAEIRYTQGGVEHLEMAKIYYSHAIKLNPNNMRSLYGLLLVSG